MADEEKNTPTSHKADEDHRSDHPLADDPTRFLESGGDDSTRVVPVHKAITERVFGPDGKTRITPVPSHLPADIDATVLRSPKPDDNDTLRVGRPETARRESSDTDLNATILRNSATRTTALMERTRQLNDTDATIHRSDEATLLSQTARVSDTTYIASVGRQIRAQGNSEAGRLLKNRFVLEEKIGSGGMGDVYKALDLRAQAAKDKNPYIAIKLLNENFMRHRDAFISLQREATRTRGIPHENIMAVFDFDAEGTTHYMSMELLDGQPLDDYLRDHSEGVSVEDSWNIINGICNGLSRAHSAGIVHSDFKPGNIFYTESKVAKVFDFGIARAISTSDGLEADGEKTVFDAGSLGALTPTYASYEMLTGKEPTKADDVYAAALVAYELFTGKHPYQRQPADKALKEGLEPEPIPFLKRRQWRALKRGLAIKSGDRCQTIDEFKEGLFSDDPPYFRYGAIALLLIASVSFGLYQSLFQTAPVIPDEVTQLQSVVMVNKGSLEGSLLDMPRIDSPEWHSQVSQALNRLTYADQELLASWPPWDSERTESQLDIGKLQMAILDTYVSEVRAIRTTTKESDQLDLITDLTLKKEEAERQLVQLQEAATYLQIAADSYAYDTARLAVEEAELQGDIELARQTLTFIERDITTQESQQAEAIAAEEARLAAAEASRIRDERYRELRTELRRVLRCKGDISDPDLTSLGQVLREKKAIYPSQYAADESGIVEALRGCVQQRIASRDPERARIVKSTVVGFLPDRTELANIQIEDLDPCGDRRLVGQGNKNLAWCRDKLFEGYGPELVVIPRPVGTETRYAISRVEIKVSDYNHFCQATGCAGKTDQSNLPVTDISFDDANAYAAWLSEQTGKVYRIPTLKEWLHAVRTDVVQEIDDNVNCSVNSRGVQLGDTLRGTTTGRPNRWGLFNYVGNAREWVVDDDVLFAAGGAHTDPMSECTIDQRISHGGEPDAITGFRLLRELKVRGG